MNHSPRVFLDTQVIYWLAKGGNELSKGALALINSSNDRRASSISLVEMQMKALAGRLMYPADFAATCAAGGIQFEPFDHLAAAQMPRFVAMSGTDPFDWMILAHAAVSPGRFLLTADQRILELGLDWVVDARA